MSDIGLFTHIDFIAWLVAGLVPGVVRAIPMRFEPARMAEEEQSSASGDCSVKYNSQCLQGRHAGI